MLVEEFRLHSELFGSRRFLAVPVFVAVVVGAGVSLLYSTGTEVSAVVAGVHALVALFGLQVGTLGLVGRDAMRDVLGDTTLLVFSARTLPISWWRLLVTFLLKDMVYYAAVFLTPLVAGFLPLAVIGGFQAAKVVLLWITLLATFALGAASSLTLIGLATRSTGLVLAVVAVLVGAAVVATPDAVAVTPYAFYIEPSVRTGLTALAPTVVAGVSGPLLFEPVRSGNARRVASDRYRTLQSVRGLDGLTARALLEVARSSGSVWKVAVSLGILFAVTALLVDRVVAATGLVPSPGIAFGTLLGLGTFTTYNWVTQFDDPAEYLRYPVRMAAVFDAKFRAHMLLAVPTGGVYLLLATVWYRPTEVVVGLVIFVLVTVYVAGLTAYLTGLSPNELLFDTVLFGLFGGGLAILAVPLLVAALAAGQAPFLAAGVAVGIAVCFAFVGIALVGRAGPRWERRFRDDAD